MTAHPPGPEARFDPLRGRWVVLAPGRAGRPHRSAASPATAGSRPVQAVEPGCPFCPGHEDQTPPEVARTGTGPPDGPGWRVRVVPNRYPIVGGSAAPGAHEVVVLSPDHRRSLGHLDDDQVVELLGTLRDRARAHAARGSSAQAFVNHGAAGGASLPHPHAQVVATDLVPPDRRDESTRIGAGGRCLLCAHIAGLSTDPVLAVTTGEAALWCPWWSGGPFEMVAAPRRHRPRFEDAGDELAAVALAVRDGLLRLDRALGDPPYNLAVHSRPGGLASDDHWHVHIWPRLQDEAGFERATGVLVNTVDPGAAAAALRRAGD